jgi:prolyl oligopeptidase
MIYTQIFLFVFCFVCSVGAEELSNSRLLSKFNSDSAERLTWVLDQNKRVNERLKLSLNIKNIEIFYRQSFDVDKIIQTEILPDGRIFKLIDRGLGKPQELVVTNMDKKEVIFSTITLSRNNTFNALSFILNSSGDKAAICLDYKGATDGFKFLVVEVESKHVLLNNHLIDFNGGKESIFFKDDQTLVVEDRESDESNSKWGLKAYPLESNQAPFYLYDKSWMEVTIDGWTYIGGDEIKSQLVSNNESFLVDILPKGNAHFLGIRNNFFYFENMINEKTQIIRISKNEPSKFELLIDLDKKIDNTIITKNHIILQEKWGIKRKLISYDLTDLSSSIIDIPDCCSLLAIKESSESKMLDVEITSELIASHHIKWNLSENNISNLDLVQQYMQSDIETKYFEIKSFDGTLIPFKIVYQKDLELKNKPVYMESYGGFSADTYVHPVYNIFNLNFIRHGGIYIGTGLRGGGEYDEKWHQDGAHNNKIKTFEDLASIAKWLIDQGISSKDQIVSAGSSNGGLTVAATGLLYPQYFGLVIPHNGVLDMLGKEELDPLFEKGWSYEYGDSRAIENHDYIKSFSPLENVANLSKGPRFLIINGRNDTRVNPAHSIKFSMAASLIPGSKIELISLNNSGHFNVSLRYNDYIAWRAQVIKWTTIYDFLNIKY